MTDRIERTLQRLGEQLPGRVSLPGDDSYAAATAIWACDYTFVRAGDLASLAFCNNWADVAADDCGYAMHLEGTTLFVIPDPFGGRTIEIDTVARELDNQTFGSVAEARRVVASAPVVTLKAWSGAVRPEARPGWSAGSRRLCQPVGRMFSERSRRPSELTELTFHGNREAHDLSRPADVTGFTASRAERASARYRRERPGAGTARRSRRRRSRDARRFAADLRDRTSKARRSLPATRSSQRVADSWPGRYRHATGGRWVVSPVLFPLTF
jgi:hypothetical protein